MPLYNKEKFVAEAIQSVLNQTFRDIQLVVVDDKSTDNSLSIARQFNDERILILSNEKNKGVSFTCNRGVRESQGEYIAFLAADDLYDSRKIEKQMEVVRRYPDDVVYANFVELNLDGTPTGRERRLTEEGFVFPQLLCGEFRMIVYDSMMFRKKTFIDVGGFDENLRYAQDYDLALRLAAVANFRVLEERLHLFRVVPDSLSRSDRVSSRSRHKVQLHIIESAYERHKALLNKDELHLARINIAHHLIMCRSYKDAFVRTVRDPTMLQAFIYCLKTW